MDQDPPQMRISQFFAAKKKKNESPSAKLEKSGKSINSQLATSPTLTHTLDNYLVNPQAQNHREAAQALDPTKRSLKLEADEELGSSQKQNVYLDNLVKGHNSEGVETKEMPNGVLPFAVCEETVSGKCVLLECSSDMRASEVGSTRCEGVTTANSKVELELAHFATNFCHYIADSLAGSKRNVSPSLLNANNSTNKKKQCTTDKQPCQTNCLNDCNSEVNSGCGKNVPSQSSEEPLKQYSSCSEELQGNSSNKNSGGMSGNDSRNLRKCNRTPLPTIEANSNPMCTMLTNIVHTRETRRWAYGSAIFSPGEEFWSEAIQLADNILAPNDDLLGCVCEGFKTTEEQHDLEKLDPSNSACCRIHLLKNDSRIRCNMPASTKLPVKHAHENASMGITGVSEGFLEESSPLPVRHLDFSNDEKDFDRKFLPYPSADTSNSSIVKTNKICITKSLNPNSVFEKSQGYKQCKDKLLSPAVENAADPEIRKKSGHPFIQEVETEFSEDGENGSGKLPSTYTIDLGRKEFNDHLISVEKCGIDSSPSSAVLLADVSSWLPSEVCGIYARKGISKLYPWQVECLQMDGILQNRNLVYCASTSAGKSFVAEVLMLRQVLSTGKIALLVLPYVSICAEKAEHLETLLRPLNKHVHSFYGSQGGGTLPKDTSIAVCTIEKANSLINRLLEESRLSEVGIIVIDELHMVGDPSRGYLLELMLTKLRYAIGEGVLEESGGGSSSVSNVSSTHWLQIVGMSATMPNVAAVADWLQAALYQTDFRPVPLEEYIKIGNTIFDRNLSIVRTLQNDADLGGKDPEHVVELCNEVVQQGHSVLIFCSSRKGCEITAKHISKYLRGFPINVADGHFGLKDSSSALEALRKCPSGLDPILEQTLPFGVAYHHAGLTVEEREIIESCYRQAIIRVLTATSTLAAGVNLPARRVIFRQPRIGRDFIDGIRYKQMAGRAGRTGIDSKGESIIICKPEETKKIVPLLNNSCQPLESCLSEDKNGMTHAILEVVAAGIVQTANDIHRYVRCTLLNTTKPFQDVVKSAQDSLRWLCHEHFLEWNEDTKLYSSTPLGRAAFGSSLAPEESLVVLSDLSRAREGLVLASDLHLVYLVTPINVDVEPDWELYYERFMELSPMDQSVGNRIGVSEPFLMHMVHGAHVCASDGYGGNKMVPHNSLGNIMTSDRQILHVSKRFYVALMLCKLVQELPVTAVCEAFKVARGMVQALQENAGRFALMVSTFCERLGWHDMEGLISRFQHRVSFGVRAEIIELTSIPYVKGSRARSLYKAGLRTPLAIVEASISEISKALSETSSWDAQGSRLQRMQFAVAKKIKAGAQKIVLEQAEQSRVAAFSALKSLGVSVPQLSQPLVSSATFNVIEGEILAITCDDDSMCKISRSHGLDVVNAPPAHEFDRSGAGKVVQLEVQDPRDDKRKQCEILPSEESAFLNNSAVSKCINGADSGVRTTVGDVHLGTALLNIEAITKGAAFASETVDKMKDKDYENGTLACSMSANIGKMTLSRMPDGFIMHEQQERENDNRCSFNYAGSSNISDRGPVNASRLFGDLDSFLTLWEDATEFFFDIHLRKVSELSSIIPFELHGIAVCWKDSPVYYVDFAKDLLTYKKLSYESCGVGRAPHSDANVGITFESKWELLKIRWNRISVIMAKTGTKKVAWNLKCQIQALQKPGMSTQIIGGLDIEHMELINDFKVIDNSYFLLPSILIQGATDIGIVSWLLWPDEESCSSPNLEKVVKKRLSMEAAAVTNRDGRWKNQMRRVAHNGCCRRVAQIRALQFALCKLLISEGLLDVLHSIENPLVKVIADMELWGIGINMDSCHRARHVLGKKLRQLEEEACRLAGTKFSLHNAADVANILYKHLKLPMTERGNRKKLHPSTDKRCLELLRNEHPIVPVVKEHRRLAKLFNTLGSICSQAKLCAISQKYKIHGRWLQTSTTTGRLSVENPNLQCVEHMLEFRIPSNSKDDSNTEYELHQINARELFIPTKDEWVILTADYSQIELRLMAHFSKDPTLIEVLANPHGDVFLMISARWTGKLHSAVSNKERDLTKRLVYGVLYGMGVRTLAEHLECSVDEAARKVHSFMSAFPGVSAWLSNTVDLCRQNGCLVLGSMHELRYLIHIINNVWPGESEILDHVNYSMISSGVRAVVSIERYIQTLKGRKRFLTMIKSRNGKEKARAERQAVNSICQGSAADIIKIAMIKFHSVIAEGCQTSDLDESIAGCYSILKGRCHILLQVHDELVLEVDPLVLNVAAFFLQKCMETAADLCVPLHIKLKTGRTWGSLEHFTVDPSKVKPCT